jgi:hypothetical protein
MDLIQRVYADQEAAGTTVSDPLNGKVTGLGNIFALIINIVLGVGWALVFVMLALGFIQYVLSKGEKTATQSAQQWITYAVIGGIGLFFVMALKAILPSLLGGTTPGGNIVAF